MFNPRIEIAWTVGEPADVNLPNLAPLPSPETENLRGNNRLRRVPDFAQILLASTAAISVANTLIYFYAGKQDRTIFSSVQAAYLILFLLWYRMSKNNTPP